MKARFILLLQLLLGVLKFMGAMAADHQKIHPVADAEAHPTVPLMTRNSSQSERGDPSIENHQYYPPFRRTIPLTHLKPPHKKRNCCCKFICWVLSLSLLLIILIAVAAGILYLIFQPKIPTYSIDRLRITDFRLNTDMSLNAQFRVMITTNNPNKNIGIYYEDGSHLSVWYTNTKLCDGFLPKFYQGHQNTTALDVVLTGRIPDGSGLLTALSKQQQQTGTVPLDLKADVPVSIKVGSLKLMKVKSLVRCKLVVDRLAANNLIFIRTSRCKFKFRL